MKAGFSRQALISEATGLQEPELKSKRACFGTTKAVPSRCLKPEA
jgi:hypothetical protein